MMVFFMDADERIYARYGGRDSKNADNRQSLAGLHYTMQSVLDMHRQEAKEFAPRTETKPKYVRDIRTGFGGRCMHCHQVKELINRQRVSDGVWDRTDAYRYPLPENLGFKLEVNRGNVVESVQPDTPAGRAGLQKGDVLRRLGPAPIHSFGDAQFALDKAPATGMLTADWQRGDERLSAKLPLSAGWRKTDLTWRPSMRRIIPSLPLYGDDLTLDERKKLGLTEKQLAFRQNDRLQSRAKTAGFQPGDVIVGLGDKDLTMDVDEFLRYIRREYLAGDRITLVVLRAGKQFRIPLTLSGR